MLGHQRTHIEIPEIESILPDIFSEVGTVTVVRMPRGRMSGPPTAIVVHLDSAALTVERSPTRSNEGITVYERTRQIGIPTTGSALSSFPIKVADIPLTGDTTIHLEFNFVIQPKAGELFTQNDCRRLLEKLATAIPKPWTIVP